MTLHPISISKINNLKIAIQSKIGNLHLQPPLPDPIHSGKLFPTVSSVTPADVSQLLHSWQSKSSNHSNIAHQSMFLTVFISHSSPCKPLIQSRCFSISPQNRSDYFPPQERNGIGTICQITGQFLTSTTFHKFLSASSWPDSNPTLSTLWLQPPPIRIPELSLQWDSSSDPAQQNQTFCRPGGIHAPDVTWPERCLRHHRSRDPTWSTSLDVWCWWNCSELASVLSNPAVPICESWPGHLFIRLTKHWCPTGFPYLARSFSLLSSPHSICCRSFQSSSATVCGWHPAFHLNFKN